MTHPSRQELIQQISALKNDPRTCQILEEQLKERDALLFQIIQGTSIPTFVIDRNHRITHWNKACENLTGLRAEHVIGTSDQWKAFYPEKRPVMADLIVDGASIEEFSHYYGKRFKPSAVIDGAFESEGFFADIGEDGKWLFFTAAPLKDADGECTGAIETLQDITARKRAQEAIRKSGERYRNLLDLAPYPVAVFSLEGRVSYLNPAFTQVFGWTLNALKGEIIPFVPHELRAENMEKFNELLENRYILRYETRRTTRDGRILDVVIRAAIYAEAEHQEPEILVILRDITREKRIARNNEAVLRISTALPEYVELEELLDYVSGEVKRLLNTEGALVILLDEENEELFLMGAAYDDSKTLERVKMVRFSLDELMAGTVIRTGKPIIVHDTAQETCHFPERDRKFGYHTRNYILVPLRSHDRIIGVLGALNKNEGQFDDMDQELLSMISGTVSLSIENARFSEELKNAYREVSSMNRAKDKAINHLSHELKTPVSILTGSLDILAKKMRALPDSAWQKTLARIQRNLARIVEIQDEADDIMQARNSRHKPAGLAQHMKHLADLVETILLEHGADHELTASVINRLDEIYWIPEARCEEILLADAVQEALHLAAEKSRHRDVDVIPCIEASPPISLPRAFLNKIVEGLIRNAVENTPDEGRVEVTVARSGTRAVLSVKDYGVGITPEGQKRIFDGFYSTRDTLAYSSGRPYDFNAGGKGADLLRMKLFSEQYHFSIEMTSRRCRHIPGESHVCPGRISACSHCQSIRDCHESGGTVFRIYFPVASRTQSKHGD